MNVGQSFVAKWMCLISIGLFLAAVPQAVTSAARMASIQAAETKAPEVVWFSDNECHGMRQDSDGNVVVANRKLMLDKPIRNLFAAAYYPKVHMLVTVDKSAATRLYSGTLNPLKLQSVRPPHGITNPASEPQAISTRIVRFTTIPGLLYIRWSYPPPSRPIQVKTEFSERIALGYLARGWHAVLTRDPHVKFLDYTYTINSKRVLHISTPKGKVILVRLPGQLADGVSDPPPYVELEPVFVLPGRGIICRTQNGWSLHDLDGRLIRYFSSSHLEKWGWLEPFFKNGHFYVGYIVYYVGGYYYRMDIPSGRLVKSNVRY